MFTGKQSWTFPSYPCILSSGVVAGPFEKQSPLKDTFDYIFDDRRMGENTFEKAQVVLMEEACQQALKKAGKTAADVAFIYGGDLINQDTGTTFASRSLNVPYYGLFGACSTSMEALSLAAQAVEMGAPLVLAGTASHYAAIEKQFRYPIEYGAQRPPTAQRTVTAGGAALIGPSGSDVVVTKSTIGKIVDHGLKDPYNMGAAMAPAAVDTILTHFSDFQMDENDYDLIITGDLGDLGRSLALEWFRQKEHPLPEAKFQDCGMLIYDNAPEAMSGASGTGCSAAVVFGKILDDIKNGRLQRVLAVATGALLSPTTYQQKESIPGIAHAVTLEAKGGGPL
ncbi:stage V sporulation protein AD [Natribacillus halophilus]|uniref:Stage V sporulation protein AD n=1 Tax=Natribacillus halophilus TaxID=549003 RepID=A0A1G8JH69_9BACI|nr:stage V sporulation protein AD [Natribacillus halophilus]SDI29970.1 stage V sporulation protein AD [Natribacillus halophilus]